MVRGDVGKIILLWSGSSLPSSWGLVVLLPFSTSALWLLIFSWSPPALMLLPVLPGPPLLPLLLLPPKSGDGTETGPKANAESDPIFFITNLRSSVSIRIRSSMPIFGVVPLGLPSFFHIPQAASPLATTPAAPISPIIIPVALSLPFLLPVAFRTTSTIAAVRMMVLA